MRHVSRTKMKKLPLRTSCLLIALLMMLASVLAGCGAENAADSGSSSSAEASEASENADSETPKPTLTPAPVVKETFEGELTDFAYGEFVLSGESEEKTFYRDAYTYYNLNGGSNLTLGDTVDVIYHDVEGKNIAEQVIVTRHEEEKSVFGGLVYRYSDGQLVVTGTEMTAQFSIDKKTKVNGELSEGDTVEVTYTGDISEEPYAVSVNVITENLQPQIYLISGTVSEVAADSILLSISSATAYRIMISSGTKITGIADKAAVGDTVSVSFTGQIDETPTAIELSILKHKEEDDIFHSINGVVDKVEKKSFTLRTKENTYTFLIYEKISYKGEKLASGQQATVTYYGKLKEDPVAVAVYCSGPLPTPTPTGTPTATPTVTPTETPAPKPTESPVPTATPTESPAPTATPTETPTPTAAPTETPTPTAEPTETPTPEPTTTPTETPTPEPTEEPTPEPTEEPIPEPTEEPTPTETPAPTPTGEPLPEIKIDGSGEIIKWKDEYIIHTDTDKKLTFTIDPEFQIASGYLPEKGDIVKFTYEAGKMSLLKLELVGKNRDTLAGWITEWDKNNNSVTITSVTGEKQKYTIAKNIDVLLGYEPKLGDFVYYKINEAKTEITYVRFLSHPEKKEEKDKEKK